MAILLNLVKDTDESADHATGCLDNVDWYSSCEGCRIMPTVEE